MTIDEFNLTSSSIPQKPGIYKYFDTNGKLIYVGKAKNIRKRVSSYFSKNKNSYKTHELVRQIASIEFTIVNTEQDALLLENELIKQCQPRFNINLKDDKTYPYIVIKNEPYPRLFLTRRKIKDGSEYLGPYTSAEKIRELLAFIKRLVPMRTCKLALTKKNIESGKFKVCLEYHLGNCLGPCIGLQSEEDYKTGLEQFKQFLKGNLAPLIQRHKTEMQEYARHLQFEKAESTLKKIDYLEAYQAKSVIVNKHVGKVDVFYLVQDGDHSFISYLILENGTIIQTHQAEFETKMYETVEDVLQFAIPALQQKFDSNTRDVVVQQQIELTNDYFVTVPLGGEKKKLLDLAAKNAQYLWHEYRRKQSLLLKNVTVDKIKILESLKEQLHLPVVPTHIECFDNSNFQGSHPVSAMVCFKNGEASKKDYRHFNVTKVSGINDFATMKDTITRRYKRLIEEGASLPNLIVIDGGKGQLSAAVEAINDLGIRSEVSIVGLAKRVEEIFFPGDNSSIKLDWKSPGLTLIRQIRDEVHRFGITHHRLRRSKNQIKSPLTDIPGIGEQSSILLLKNFKSLNRIRNTSIETLTEVIGKQKALIVYQHFHNQTGPE
jgi:excinuclease ABC subunit C